MTYKKKDRAQSLSSIFFQQTIEFVFKGLISYHESPIDYRVFLGRISDNKHNIKIIRHLSLHRVFSNSIIVIYFLFFDKTGYDRPIGHRKEILKAISDYYYLYGGGYGLALPLYVVDCGSVLLPSSFPSVLS